MAVILKVLRWVALWSLLLLQCALGSHHEKHFFPKTIPKYEIRKDSHTEQTVTRGRLHLINYNVSHAKFPENNELQKSKMVTFADLQRHLQCAPPAVEMDGTRGGWSLLQMVPPTKQIVEQVCAFAESKCHPWAECRNTVKSFKSGMYEKRSAKDVLEDMWGTFRDPVLLRVINNELYYDWPWGIERFTELKDHYNDRYTFHYALIELILRLVSDIGDSAFFFAGERAFLPWNVPFPTFSFAPSLSTADFPFPWYESYDQELDRYAAAESNRNFTDAFYRKSQRSWETRIPKAAFFASYQLSRQVIFDSAALRPDLFDVSFTSTDVAISAWNPASNESNFDALLYLHTTNQSSLHNFRGKESKHGPGFIDPIFKFGDARRYTPHYYKYVIVPVGSLDQSSSQRFAGLLAHSGAVVLLQKSEFAYHFSARLEPWVHYVPLSHSMADVIDKIEWLQRHDHLARRIVRNAQNFAQSYLRAEDYLCYAAGSLRLLHDLEKTTDVLQGFAPLKLNRIEIEQNLN